MNNRIKEIRNTLGLNQEKFGKTIGLSKFAISNYENRRAPITDRSVADICREFSVNEKWLRYGTGEMFKPDDDDLDYLVGKYGKSLSEAQKALMVAILKMDDKQRKAVNVFLDNLLLLRKKP